MMTTIIPPVKTQLNFHIIDRDLQNFSSVTIYQFNAIFLTPVLLMTILRHSLTNISPLCILTNHNCPIEIPKTKMNYNHNREKKIVFFLPSPSNPVKTFTFTNLKLDLVDNVKSIVLSTKVSFWFKIDCTSCILKLKLYYLIWKYFQNTQTKKNFLEIKSDNFRTTTILGH